MENDSALTDLSLSIPLITYDKLYLYADQQKQCFNWIKMIFELGHSYTDIQPDEFESNRNKFKFCHSPLIVTLTYHFHIFIDRDWTTIATASKESAFRFLV